MHKAVFDCNIFAQALINSNGPSGICVQAVLNGEVTLFIADFVIAEIRDIPNKPTPARLGVSAQKAETLVQLLLIKSELISSFPSQFIHPIDENDSDYINLALAADAKLIVSRDRHLLNLNNPLKPWSADFRARFPHLQVISPVQLLAELRR